MMLGDKIKELRQKKGLTQEELAARLHVVRQTVSKWEKNRSVPDADALKDIAEILEVPVSTLLGGEELWRSSLAVSLPSSSPGITISWPFGTTALSGSGGRSNGYCLYLLSLRLR